MKKVLFLIPFVFDGKGGPRHKFLAQIHAALDSGFEVWHTAYTWREKKIYLCNDNDGTSILLGKSCGKNKFIVQMSFIYSKINKILSAEKFDLCYVRDSVPTPFYIKALKTIKEKGIKCVVEIPTYPSVEENKNSHRKLFYFAVNTLNRMFGKKVPKYVDLYTLIGEKADSYMGRPAINIQNAVHIKGTNVKKENKNKRENEIHLTGVATMSYWHGYDRVIEGMKNYYSNKQDIKIIMHFVGKDSDGSLGRWKELADKYGLNDYVVYEGFKGGRELDESFDNADIAIASLGLYREKLNVVPSIKICEYCARGIPFVYAGNSELVDGRDDFTLKISNDDEPVNMDDVISFYEKVKKNPEISGKMRKFAEENMDWKIWFEKIINSI
jgi:glycosyltransferase involved in cell wall biosynthesis